MGKSMEQQLLLKGLLIPPIPNLLSGNDNPATISLATRCPDHGNSHLTKK